MIEKKLNVKFRERKYAITYKETKEVLYFKDDSGGVIGFVKSKEAGLGVCINDAYKKSLANYPELKGHNAYTMSKEQVDIFTKWLGK